MSKPEELKALQTKVDDIALRGASKEDIEKLEKLIKDGSSPKPPATPPAEPATTLKREELEELKQYRETERQALLKEMPKNIVDEFKLTNQTLEEVRRIHKLTRALQVKNVGVETPPPTSTAIEKKYRWNPVTQKNEFW